MTDMPILKNDDPAYRMIRDGSIEEFNAHKAGGGEVDLKGCDFRGVDLKGIDASGLDMRDCYFRQADLRGIDFSQTNLEGSSINSAKISGTFFPKELTADELELSLVHGTRMRYAKVLVINKAAQKS
ncbi:MAG TPA: hypothetical protein ENK35_10765 [Candidatus Tenderia sp.]|nr:hypothetical protein [Candidatus Tenderia sp.]